MVPQGNGARRTSAAVFPIIAAAPVTAQSLEPRVAMVVRDGPASTQERIARARIHAPMEVKSYLEFFRCSEEG